MKKTIIYPTLCLIVLACSQQNSQITSEQDSIKSVHAVFSGPWVSISTNNGTEFSLTIKQINDSIIASHSAVTQNGSRIDSDEKSVTGLVSGNMTTVEFTSTFGGSGKATLSINEQNQLIWKITDSDGEYYLPAEAVLVNKDIDVSVNEIIDEEEFSEQEIKVQSLNNIEDYFRYIPKTYLLPLYNMDDRERIINKFYNPGTVKENDPAWQVSISILDVKNGYMKIITDADSDVTSDYEIAIFRKKDKTYIASISEEKCAVNGCFEYKINFLQYGNNQWNNIKSEVFPEIDILEYCKKNIGNQVKEYVRQYIAVKYLLPQTGTDITIRLVENFDPMIDASLADKTLAAIEYNLIIISWKDDKFYISKKLFEEDE